MGDKVEANKPPRRRETECVKGCDMPCESGFGPEPPGDERRPMVFCATCGRTFIDLSSLTKVLSIVSLIRPDRDVAWPTVAGQRKTKFRGRDRVGWAFAFAAAAYNLVRLPKLMALA
jgi:hypothetical protein